MVVCRRWGFLLRKSYGGQAGCRGTQPSREGHGGGTGVTLPIRVLFRKLSLSLVWVQAEVFAVVVGVEAEGRFVVGSGWFGGLDA